MHRDQSLRFAGFWMHFGQPRDWFTGGMIPAHCGFECGDRLCERLTLATSAAFDAGQVRHAGDDYSVRCRCDVNHAIEYWHWLGARRLAHHGVTLARLIGWKRCVISSGPLRRRDEWPACRTFR